MGRKENRKKDQAIKRATKKINKPYVMQKLPPEEHRILEKYIEESANAIIEKRSSDAAVLVVNETWAEMETELIESMRNHHISQERIEKIITMMNKSLAIKSDTELKLDEDMKAFITLNQNDFALLASEAMDSSCKGCKKCSKQCDLFKILKKKAVPNDSTKVNCIYAY